MFFSLECVNFWLIENVTTNLHKKYLVIWRKCLSISYFLTFKRALRNVNLLKCRNWWYIKQINLFILDLSVKEPYFLCFNSIFLFRFGWFRFLFVKWLLLFVQNLFSFIFLYACTIFDPWNLQSISFLNTI